MALQYPKLNFIEQNGTYDGLTNYKFSDSWWSKF